jgi:hypothetical protein
MAVYPPPFGEGAIRDPKDTRQQKGQILNPPRRYELAADRRSVKGAMGQAVEKPAPGAKG